MVCECISRWQRSDVLQRHVCNVGSVATLRQACVYVVTTASPLPSHLGRFYFAECCTCCHPIHSEDEQTADTSASQYLSRSLLGKTKLSAQRSASRLSCACTWCKQSWIANVICSQLQILHWCQISGSARTHNLSHTSSTCSQAVAVFMYFLVCSLRWLLWAAATIDKHNSARRLVASAALPRNALYVYTLTEWAGLRKVGCASFAKLLGC